MSQENVEAVLAGTEAYARGDLDATLALCAPDVEVFPDRTVFPEAEPLAGRDAYRRWLEEVASPWVQVEVEVRESSRCRMAESFCDRTGAASGEVAGCALPPASLESSPSVRA